LIFEMVFLTRFLIFMHTLTFFFSLTILKPRKAERYQTLTGSKGFKITVEGLKAFEESAGYGIAGKGKGPSCDNGAEKSFWNKDST